jgi:hypothetical protein
MWVCLLSCLGLGSLLHAVVLMGVGDGISVLMVRASMMLVVLMLLQPLLWSLQLSERTVLSVSRVRAEVTMLVALLLLLLLLVLALKLIVWVHFTAAPENLIALGLYAWSWPGMRGSQALAHTNEGECCQSWALHKPWPRVLLASNP